MTNDFKAVLATFLVISAVSPEGGYGGIDRCITCKKNGRDKSKDEETGQAFDFCKICPYNMTNAYKPMN